MPNDAQNVRIGGVRGLDADYAVRVVVHYDAKSNATIFDAEVAGQRTLICRREGRFSEEGRAMRRLPKVFAGGQEAADLR